MNLDDFSQKIITFLDKKFSEETSISKSPVGHLAYEYGLKPNTEPFYVVQITDDYASDEVFNDELTRTISLQIHIYSVKMKINDVITSANRAAYKLADMCIGYLKELKYSDDDIKSMRKTGGTISLPYEDGSKSYMSILRYIIKI